MNMSTLLTQMGILVFIMLTGFVCAKLGVAGPSFTASASRVVINVLLSFTIFYSVMDSDVEMSLGDIGFAVLCFAALFLIMSAVAFAAVKLMRLKMPQSGISMFAITFPNTVFMAFPVVEAVLGSAGLFVAVLSNIPFNILAYTLGLAQIRGGFRGLGLKRMLCPPLIASVLAVALFISGLEVPLPVKEAFRTVSSATVPMSMLIVGVSLGSLPARHAFLNWRAYAVSAVKLVLVPLVVYSALRLFGADELLLGTAVILLSAPAAMIITPLAIQYGSDEAYASECVFISTVLSAVTMPAVIWLLL